LSLNYIIMKNYKTIIKEIQVTGTYYEILNAIKSVPNYFHLNKIEPISNVHPTIENFLPKFIKTP